MKLKEKDDHKSTKQALKFMFFLIIAEIIQAALFTLFSEIFLLDAWKCHLISQIFSVFLLFFLNHHYTFKASERLFTALLLTAVFYLFFTPLSTLYVREMAARHNRYLVELSILLINLVLEFLYSKYLVYGYLYNHKKKGG